jgi:phosphatidylglycerol:prolipoprotein diacylglycerol transferase
MFRTLFDLGPIGIHSYGLMLALAFFTGLWYINKRSKAEKLSFDKMLNIAYILIFSGVIGGRLGFVVLHWSDYADNPLAAINPFQGSTFGLSGLNLYGGIMLALVACLIYMNIRKLPRFAIFDLFAPTVGLGIGMGRIGCFLNGCCFGTPTDLPWGITFPEDSIPAYIFPDQAIHPAQLYSSAYGILLFVFLHQVLKRKRFDGQVIAVLLMVEAVFRFVIENVRYYESEMTFSLMGIQPTYNHAASILLFITGLVFYIKLPRRLYRNKPATTTGNCQSDYLQRIYFCYWHGYCLMRCLNQPKVIGDAASESQANIIYAAYRRDFLLRDFHPLYRPDSR